MREQFSNNAQTTLSAAITSTGATSLTVASATAFPGAQFRILIDSEIMLVTAVSGTTFTVARGQEGTTAATHSSGANVAHILTKGSTQRFMRDNVAFADDSNRPPFALLDASGNILTSASFTTINGTLATITDEASGPISIAKTKLSSGGEDVTFLARSAPSTPYQIYAAMEGAMLDPTEYSGFGIGFRESSSGKMTLLVLSMNGGSVFPQMAIYNFNSATSFNAALVSRFACYLPSPKWFSIKDDGTNVYFYASHNGIQWIQVGSASRTSWMTTGPDQIGFALSSSFNTSYPIAASLMTWQE
ncbi:MAG TPA: hypothetical protein VG826_05365 [Pirellulales bacterium]|nr:hypothetical protein [Pirellulales bacterium]